MGSLKCFYKWREVLLITLVFKLFLIFFAAIIHHNLTDFLSTWVRWDSNWYIAITQNWYQPVGKDALAIVFYPLYPILISLSNLIFQNLTLSSLVISVFFSFAASVALYELVLLDFKKETALRSVWFLNIFPTAYFLQAAYTESLFLTVSILTIYFLRKEKTLNSSIFGFLSSLTRVNGILLLPIIFLESKNSLRFLSMFFTSGGVLTYLLINYITFKDPFYFIEPLNSNWFKHLDVPWVGINGLIFRAFNTQNPDYIVWLTEFVILILVFILGILIFYNLRVSYGVYVLSSILLFISTSFVTSIPRYSLVLFPIYIYLGKIKSKIFFTITSTIFLGFLLYYTAIFTAGGWAF